MTRRLLPLALAAAAFAAPSASAYEQTITVKPLGCDVTVSVTEVFLQTSNPPRLGTSGNTGATTDCP